MAVTIGKGTKYNSKTKTGWKREGDRWVYYEKGVKKKSAELGKKFLSAINKKVVKPVGNALRDASRIGQSSDYYDKTKGRYLTKNELRAKNIKDNKNKVKIRKVEVEKTKPETRQEKIKREGLATWRVDADEQKKLNINKKKIKVDPPKTTNKTTSTTERKKIPGEFPGTREEFDKKYAIEDKGDKKESNNNKVKIKQEDSKPKEVNQKVKINKTEKKNPFRPGMSERQIKSQIRVLKRRNKASDRLKIKRLQKKLAAF
jgi:hypothetical protein